MNRREKGAFAIMFVPLLLLMLALSALALDAGQLYNRNADLSGMAKAVALAAARELNGTDTGITAAKTRAKETAEAFRYQYFGEGSRVVWNEKALSFSTGSARDGEWIPASSAATSPQATRSALYYAKVDTAGLDTTVGTVNTFLMHIFSGVSSTLQLNASAVAGRSTLNVTPIAVCAMSSDPASKNTYPNPGGGTLEELVQFGFRRGVSYDLMQLNPNGTSAVSYVINPVVVPGGSSSAFDTAMLGPFMCSGSVWVPRLTGGSIRVSKLPSTHPLETLDIPLNARFDIYGGGPCAANGAPPDYNVKQYEYDKSASVKWMSPIMGSRAAATVTSRGKRETAADLPTPPALPGDYGPLWAFAKAAKAPTPIDAPEPSSGYPTFSPSEWPILYKSGPTAPNYPTATATPYLSTNTSSGNYNSPSTANLEISTLQRRVLNVPLLSCSPSAPSGTNVSANVVAIAKFFMTVPATQDSLIAEFAGLMPEQALSGQVELYP
jgi:Flp pilus assembly protein TadG